MESVTICPLCASDDVEIYLNVEGHSLGPSTLGPARTDVTPGRILRCRACRVGFRELRPSDKEMSRLYSELDSEGYQSELPGRSRTARSHLRIVNRYVSGGRLLDVGCASGVFLRYAAEAGWQVVGVEPSGALYDKASERLNGRGVIYCATLEKAPLPPASFDVITLWDVLEHVPDPIRFMRTCGSLLKPNGHLFVNVPDLDSLQARLLGLRWPLLLPEHLNYFNRQSLSLCGRLAGLNWLHFGRRFAYFSVKYVLFRLSQHGIVGASIGQRIVDRCGIGGVVIPVSLGELYGVWRR